MRFRRTVAAALAAAGFLFGAAPAPEITIIAHPSVNVSTLTPEDIRLIYLRLKNALNGGRLEPALLRSGPAHQAFLRDYIGRSGPALETYYRSLLFSGKAPAPESFSSEAAMIEYVATTQGAIGYVSAAAVSSRVRTIAVH